jgi:hypothetical protein
MRRRQLLAGAATGASGVVASRALWQPQAEGVRLASPGVDALQAAVDDGPGIVQLGPGVYSQTATLRLKADVIVQGAGAATRIVAARPMRALVTAGDSSESSAAFGDRPSRTQLRDLVVDCAGQAEIGVVVDPAQGTDYADGEPDPSVRMSDVWVYGAANIGVYVGRYARSSYISTVRVRRAGLFGFVFGQPDSFVSNCEATTQRQTGTPAVPELPRTGASFHINSANSSYVNLKGWYSRGYGFHLRGTRNQLSNSYSQDTNLHGFYCEWSGGNTIVGCQADTPGMHDVGGAADQDGFYFEGMGFDVVSGCTAYDRRPGGAAVNMRHGFNFPAEWRDSGQAGQLAVGQRLGEAVHYR